MSKKKKQNNKKQNVVDYSEYNEVILNADVLNQLCEITLGKINNKILLHSLEIPYTYEYNGEKYKITSIGKETFKDFKGLKKVLISEGIKKIEARAFMGCLSLEEIKMPNTIEEIETAAF